MKIFKLKILLIFTKLIQIDYFYNFLQPIAKFGVFLTRKRLNYLKLKENQSLVNIKDDNEIDVLFDDLIVKNGPFKGLVYPNLKATGSRIYPKLLGSYEKELHSEIENLLLNNQYNSILDIGCAEGYYAIGFAVRQPNAIIYAYDLAEMAREMCYKMAVVNKVDDRVIINSYCSPEIIKNFNLENSLIFCDCEGFESELFNSNNVSNLKKCTLIIETHDCFDIEISRQLKELFRESHEIKSIYSVDDIHKTLNINCNYDYSELNNLSNQNRKNILSEGRINIMEWLILRPF